MPHTQLNEGEHACDNHSGFQISPVEEIIEELAAGRMVIIVDEADRENEGDLLIAAEHVTAEAINFMARFGRGLICLTLTEERCRALGLPMMVDSNKSPHHTNFTVSIEAASGVTTGISAPDRARTVQVAVSANVTPDAIVQPGHVFPLRAHPGGVLARAGHTEAGCDLARLGGLTPASVICEILNDDGTMARLPDLTEFAVKHGLKVGTIVDLIHYRSRSESLVTRLSERDIETPYGPCKLVVYNDSIAKTQHMALIRGDIDDGNEVLTRVHEPTSPIDLLDINDHRHSWNFHESLARISREGRGVLVLLNWAAGSSVVAEGMSNSATRNMAGWSSSELRDFGIGAQILKDLGVRRLRLMAHPRTMPNMSGFDLQVVGYESPATIGQESFVPSPSGDWIFPRSGARAVA